MTAQFEQNTTRAMAAAIRDKAISAREAVEAHFARIDAVNPELNAVVTQVRDQAYDAATRADERTAAGEALPPLHGVPMTHKDTHSTTGIRTTSGSPVYADFVPDVNDLIIDRFQAAGAISTGKNNVPEFAAGSHTFNDVFGTTTNPYDVTRSAGGSSGGAAAAVAARIQPMGDGSDMGGSLRNPAAFCNVVGFRPSHGVLPVAPARNAWAWLSRTGPMARTVDDIALAMSVLAGPDPRVPSGCPVTAADFGADLAAESAETRQSERPLAGVRIGLTTDFGLGVPVESEIVEVLRAQAKVFEELGATVEQACPDLSDADEVFDVTRAFDMATNLRDVVAEHRDRVKSDVIWNVEKGLNLTAADLMTTAVARTRLHESMRSFFDSYDVLLSPTTQVLPFESEQRWPKAVAGVQMRSYIEWMRSVCLISATGCPAISVPGGFSTAGLPVGLQLVAAHGDDVRLLRLSTAFEAATRHADHAPAMTR